MVLYLRQHFSSPSGPLTLPTSCQLPTIMLAGLGFWSPSWSFAIVNICNLNFIDCNKISIPNLNYHLHSLLPLGGCNNDCSDNHPFVIGFQSFCTRPSHINSSSSISSNQLGSYISTNPCPGYISITLYNGPLSSLVGSISVRTKETSFNFSPPYLLTHYFIVLVLFVLAI